MNEQREWGEAGGGAETGFWVLRVWVRVWYSGMFGLETHRTRRGLGGGRLGTTEVRPPEL